MEAPSFRKVMIVMALIFACQRKSSSEEVLERFCSNSVNPEYSAQVMSETASLINSVPNNKYSYLIWNSFNVNGRTMPFWAHGACNGQVDAGTCQGCLTLALYHLNTCLGKIGGHVKATNCRLRYESYKFDFIW
ncbi:hypothetical protein MLD38_037431 [Melastoma candidum]|uniref:Uncharacterized protein n=1 Tax=Melastoma candidum TaxID=119954 RepID=A0ACB9LNW0_9MYRT|nr:hypothetical protein MLD38_037431 [Melastoma candidum]